MALASTTCSISIHSPKPRFLLDTPKPNSSFHVTCQHSCNPNQHSPSKTPFSVAKSVAVPAALIASLASSPWALAAKQIAESPQQDNRGLALLLPIVPAVGWVLFNILGPALNQVNRMRNDKAVVIGLGGLGAYLSSSALFAPAANAAAEVVEAEAAAGGGNSGLLPYIVAAAVAFEVILLSTMQSKYEEKKE
ncbi:hypothetical protein vseg_010332 [Gypsophila vaccaria]